MSYQGVVTDASGVAIDGNVDLTFILWDAAAEGTQVWTETQPSTPLSNGIFNVILGSVNAFNIPFDKQLLARCDSRHRPGAYAPCTTDVLAV